MERSDYWWALVRGWWLIAIFGLAGLAVGLMLPRHVSPTKYVSYSSIGSPPTSGTSNSSIPTDQILYFGTTDGVLTEADKLSGLNEPLWKVRSQISLIGPPSASGSSGPTSGQVGVVDVNVEAPTSAKAIALNKGFDTAMGDAVASSAKESLQTLESQTEATLASVMREIASKNYPPGVTADALDVQVSALQNYLAGLVVQQPDTGFEVLQGPLPADVNKVTTSTAVNSRPLRAAAGLVIGLALGALAALAMWLLDRRLKTARRAQLALGYPVVAEIPSESSDSTEVYRMLWLSVFREPLPLPPVAGNERLYEGEDPVLDAGPGSRSGRGTP